MQYGFGLHCLIFWSAFVRQHKKKGAKKKKPRREVKWQAPECHTTMIFQRAASHSVWPLCRRFITGFSISLSLSGRMLVFTFLNFCVVVVDVVLDTPTNSVLTLLL